MLFDTYYTSVVILHTVKITTDHNKIYRYGSYHVNKVFKKLKFIFRPVWSISIYYGKIFTTRVSLYHKNPFRFILHLNATRQALLKQYYLSSTMGRVCTK